MKPGNILIGKDGQVKLTDFGLTRQQSDPSKTLPGIAVGTVYYMSPEQVRAAGPIDDRSDLYSTAIVFYEMLTGRRPFDGAEQFAIMRAQVELTPPPPSSYARFLPPAVNQVLARALQKDPALRYQSAAEFRAAIAALPSAWMVPPVPPKRWNARLKFGAVMCGTTILVLSAFALPPWIPSYEPRFETLELNPPAAPLPPPGALVMPAAAPIEPPPAVAPPATVAAPRPPPASPRRPPARVEPPAPRPFSATRIVNADPEPPPAPPLPRIEASPVPPPPSESKTPPVAPAPPPTPVQTPAPDVQQQQKPQDPRWMRRTVRGFPRLFRRKNAEPEQGKPKQ